MKFFLWLLLLSICGDVSVHSKDLLTSVNPNPQRSCTITGAFLKGATFRRIMFNRYISKYWWLLCNLKHHHSQFLCVISQSTYYSKSSQFSTTISQFLNFNESTQSAFSADEQLWKVFMILDWIECVKVPNTSFHSINSSPSVDANMGIWSLCSSIYRKSFIVSLMKRFQECY